MDSLPENPLREAINKPSSITDDKKIEVSPTELANQLKEILCKDRVFEKWFVIGKMNYNAFPNDPLKAVIFALKEVCSQDLEPADTKIIKQTFEVVVSACQFLPETDRKKIIGALIGIALSSLQ